MTGHRMRPVAVSCVALALTIGLGAPQLDARSPQSSELVATVGDRTITLEEVEQRWGELDVASRTQIRQQLYDARRRVVDEIIGNYLIELEAKAQGVSKNQLLENEAAKRSRPITQEEIASVFQRLGNRPEGAALDQLTPSIREYIDQQHVAEARQAFINELRKKTEVRVRLEPPRVHVTTSSSDPALGPSSAPVEIVEFSDFQCPYCKAATPALDKLRKTFGDRIRLVYKDFPLPSHPDAFPAAEAARCAREQGKFWEYHDALFANQHALASEHLKEYAASLGMNTVAFNACLDEHRFKPLVQSNIDEIRRYGVASTPTFSINGRVVMGALPYETFDQIIREELALKGK